MTDSIVLTPEGYLELEQELNELKNVRRPEIIRALKEARAQGDLSENADYDAARNDQAKVEAQIKELEYQLEHAIIADNKKTAGKVSIGCTVTIAYAEDDTEDFKLVGATEADIFNNKISNDSPLGKAIFNHKKGDKVMVESSNGGYEVTIVNIA